MVSDRTTRGKVLPIKVRTATIRHSVPLRLQAAAAAAGMKESGLLAVPVVAAADCPPRMEAPAPRIKATTVETERTMLVIRVEAAAVPGRLVKPLQTETWQQETGEMDSIIPAFSGQMWETPAGSAVAVAALDTVTIHHQTAAQEDKAAGVMEAATTGELPKVRTLCLAPVAVAAQGMVLVQRVMPAMEVAVS